MTEASNLESIRSILEDEFEINPERVTLEARLFEDLSIDSIDAVDLLVRLKDLSGKHISPEQFKEVRTVGDVLSVLMRA